MSTTFTSNRAAVKAQMEQNIAAWARATGEEFTANAKQNRFMRVDTGRMRDAQGFSTSEDNRTVIVGNRTEYAVHVHFPGVSRQWQGSPFITDTMNNFGADAQRIAGATLTRGFK